MSDDLLAQTGVHFFGRMSASATHEIKNALAIINESAGLLEDLSMMIPQGHPVTEERIQSVTRRVSGQIRRADKVLKRLNRFSHSSDEALQLVNLEETVRFVLDLSGRLLDMMEAKVDVETPASPVMVETSLFFLENMIWRAIEAAVTLASEEKSVTISIEDLQGVSIWFSLKSPDAGSTGHLFDSDQDRALMRCLGLSVRPKKNGQGFGLLWTADA